MPTISQSVTINADVATVFDLISRVEEFPLYASMLKEVREIGHHTYRWVARVRALTLSWDSAITEFRRPTQLTWRSIRGFKNSGTYRLTNIPEGTRVELTIEYFFQGGLFDGLMEALVIPLARTAAASILAKVKARLEHAHSIHSAKEHTDRKRRFLHDFANKPHLGPRA
jgi:uncharacterized membrane protein